MGSVLGWMDVVGQDLAPMRDFYRRAFGWGITSPWDHHQGEYRMLTSQGHFVAGIEQITPEKGLARWTVFIVTDDMEQTLASAIAAAGAVTFLPQDIGDLGTVAMITDPLGSTLGVWKPQSFDPRDIPAVPGRFAGAELITTDPERTAAFLTAVMGSSVGVLSRGEQEEWVPVLAVDDLSEALASIVSSGGTVAPARPDGIVGAADPGGAAFWVVQR
jgi:predicted enzyme related to lactoylglutathione lyase